MKMKTEKLFWKDAYLKEFKANIVSVEPYKEDASKFVVVLDKTAFYPEGGGQPWDRGKIGDANVLYVYEEDELILHVVDKTPTDSQDILCCIDWTRRFDFMQQHLGQHILSSVFEKLYDTSTVGFHLGNEFVTIDIDKLSFDSHEAEAVEISANEIIYDNLQVRTLYPTKEEVSNLPLRKPPTVSEGIRIVEVDGYDFSPCGGTHPKKTGAVGIIKIRKWEKNKSNIRIEFVCGTRALKDYSWKNQQINRITSMLSVRDCEAEDAVTRIFQENKELNKTVRTFKRSLMNYQVKELYANADKIGNYSLVIKIFEGEDIKDIKVMASTLVQYPNTISLLATKADKAQVIFSCSKEVPVNMNQLFKEVIPLINGKGGGNATSAQGGGDETYNLEGLMQAAHKKIIMEYIK
ncbi:alanyl-tRNA synthetase [Anaerovirgula multivorans]|uniref:Alanine--tRNA ligase n=1 Tax=Anaerovirgula multivorans TaxID=312168 RepID=A0A239JV29_9FIRM|nr:DHHA1 domain-containing protein [Anaerovirgula multivorans]SNT09223.1 alanyl-tRNA synthetase [Anaerovirgula multivorans]